MFTRLMIAGCLLAGLLLDATAAVAQEANPNAVWNNADSGSLAERAPGNLVADGFVRHNDFNNAAFSRPEITEEGQDRVTQQLKVRVLEILFQNFNAALLALDNALRAQAGFTPYVPAPITPNTSTTLKAQIESPSQNLKDFGALLDAVEPDAP